MSEVKVSIHQFEGPLALLLYLIRKEDMDIFDINIMQITDQYLAYVKNMKTLDLEGAGDFIAMAATLIQIKSRMLMPPEISEEDLEELEDPRKQLVDRLLEYEAFQKVSKELYERPLLGRDSWSKGYKEKSTLKRPDDLVKVEDNPLYALIVHYKKALKKAKKVVHTVGAKLQSIASRVMELKEALVGSVKTTLSELSRVQSDFTTEERSRLLITFLSLLELSKMGYTSLFQSENYADIHVSVKQDLSKGDVVSQVEDYETLNEELHTDLFASSKISIDPQEVFADDEATDEATDEEIEQAEISLNLPSVEV